MRSTPDTQPLAEALAAFRATRSDYQSTSDQALTQLMVSLAEEVIALRRQPAAAASHPEAPDIPVLQAQLAALQAAYENQQAEVARLRALVASPRAASLRSRVVSPPRAMRPMDYWEQHVPDYGDTTAEADLTTYRTKRRVRPEDVVLTAEEHARLEQRRPTQLPQSQWVTTLVWIIALLLLLFVLNSIIDLRGLLEGLR
jgi:hypothetical protein